MARPGVRPATLDDQEVVAAVRVATWRVAYAGIVPRGALDAMDPVAQGARWRAWFADRPPTEYQYVAEHRGRVVGFVHGGRYRDDDGLAPDAGEVYALYVLPEEQGMGFGTALLETAVEHLRDRRLSPVLLWVLRDNTPTRRFYERRGFAPDGAEHFYDVDGLPLPEVRYRLG
jgi:GNAT superfamily N-acetyltransferase